MTGILRRPRRSSGKQNLHRSPTPIRSIRATLTSACFQRMLAERASPSTCTPDADHDMGVVLSKQLLISWWDTRRQTKRLESHWALGTHYSQLFRVEAGPALLISLLHLS